MTSGQGSKHRDWTASRWWARWRSQSSSCQHHVITWRGLIPADHEYLDSAAWPCHDCEVAPVWHHDVTNARTCQFFRRLTVFPFEFLPRTFTIGFYGKNSIISELMILECSFPLKTAFFLDWQSSFNRSRRIPEICRFVADETFSPGVLKGFQSLWLVSSLLNRLKLLEFQVTTKASVFGHRFLPKESTGSRDTLLVHNAAILAGVYEAALRIWTLQEVPVNGSEKRWNIFSHPRAWHLQLHGRKLVVRAALLKVEGSCKLVSQVSLHCRQKKRARKAFLSKKNIIRKKMSIHNFDHMVKRTYMTTHACRYQKWKAMLSHALGRSCIMRRCVGLRRWLKFWSFDIGPMMSCVKMCCHLTFARIQKEQKGQNNYFFVIRKISELNLNAPQFLWQFLFVINPRPSHLLYTYKIANSRHIKQQDFLHWNIR